MRALIFALLVFVPVHASALDSGACLPIKDLNAALKAKGQRSLIFASIYPTLSDSRQHVAAVFTADAGGEGYLLEFDRPLGEPATKGCVKLALTKVTLSDISAADIPPHASLQLDPRTTTERCARGDLKPCMHHNAAIRALYKDGQRIALTGIALLDPRAAETERPGFFTFVIDTAKPPNGVLLLTRKQGALAPAPAKTPHEWDGREVVVAGVRMTNGDRTAARQRVLQNKEKAAKEAIEKGNIKPGQEAEFIHALERMLELELIERSLPGIFPGFADVSYTEHALERLKTSR